MATNTLSDVSIRKLTSVETPLKLYDGAGLYLLVKPNGARLWRMKYRFGGVEKVLAFGAYPEIPLKQARLKRDEARALLDQNIDPGERRRADRQARNPGTTVGLAFAAIAEEWFTHYREQKELEGKPLAPSTIERTAWLLNLKEYRAKGDKGDVAHFLHALSQRQIRTITQADIAAVMELLKRRGILETAHRLLGAMNSVFRYAIGTGRAKHNPAAAFRDSPDPRDKLPTPAVRHHAAITDPKKVGELLRAMWGYRGHWTTQAALKLSAYLFTRPCELRAARWSEVDLGDAMPLWRIVTGRMKTRREHVVPLPRQAVAILKELQLFTGSEGFLFPCIRDARRSLSENSLTAALRRMGYTGDEQTWHGFRTIASTLLREENLELNDSVIERQLDHQEGSDVKRAYDRSTRIKPRYLMMQKYADYLDGLRSGERDSLDSSA
jgi:Phage integrase family.